jgi:WD40 repeat protein
MYTGTTITTYTGHTAFVQAVAWSPDGRYVASASKDYSVHVWGATTGMRLVAYRGHKADVFTLAWSSQGQYIASGGMDDEVHVWEAATGAPLVVYDDPQSWVEAITWSPDGRRVVAGSWHGIYIWEPPIQQPVLVRRIRHTATAMAWSPDGLSIVSGFDRAHLQVWEVGTRKVTRTYRGHKKGVSAVAWSPDGALIASAGYDATVHVWEARTGRPVTTYRGHPAFELASVWSPDAGRLVTTYEGHPVIIFALAWSPDGRYLATASGNSIEFPHSGQGQAILPMDRKDNTVQIWEATTARHIFTYYGHSGPVKSVAWSPDGMQLASGSWDRTAHVWQAP